MKRQSLGNQEEEVDSVGGVLTEKWVIPDAPPPAKKCVSLSTMKTEYFLSSRGRQKIDSFVECEGLDKFGRYSFNGCNKEIEVG